MTAPLVRWTRRGLDGLLLAAILAVALVGGLSLLAPVLGGTTLIIAGGSMEPAIPKGAYVLAVATAFEDLRVGDVVTVREGTKAPVTHRIVRFADLPSSSGPVHHVELKGDANAAPDPVLVPASAILGRVELSLPFAGYLAALLASPLGLVGFLACCVTILCVVWTLEEVEDGRCPACALARATKPAVAGAPGGTTAVGPVVAGAVPVLARTAGVVHHVRAGAPARPPGAPVVGPAMYDRGVVPGVVEPAPGASGDAGARAA